jgi:hypothetical protein
MVTPAYQAHPARKRRTVWAYIGVAVVVLVAAIATAVIWSHMDSVPVQFVNDSTESVIIPDCGSDLAQIGAGQSAVLSVNKQSQHCSVDGMRGGNEAVVGCLTLPSPLAANAVVHISDAKPVTRSHPCG